MPADRSPMSRVGRTVQQPVQEGVRGLPLRLLGGCFCRVHARMSHQARSDRAGGYANPSRGCQVPSCHQIRLWTSAFGLRSTRCNFNRAGCIRLCCMRACLSEKLLSQSMLRAVFLKEYLPMHAPPEAAVCKCSRHGDTTHRNRWISHFIWQPRDPWVLLGCFLPF